MPKSEDRKAYISISSAALIVANIVPLLGVLFLDWRVGDVVLLYWAESAVIGIFNLAKMCVIDFGGAMFYGLFFMVHYGIFMAVHLGIVASLFPDDLEALFTTPTNESHQLWHLVFALGALLISHGVSFFTNFLANREYEGRSLVTQMREPYGRILVMHFTVLIGGFIAVSLKDSSYMILVLMIILKVVTDFWAHMKEHKIMGSE